LAFSSFLYLFFNTHNLSPFGSSEIL
jgi:hypothetical protein